MVRASHDDRYDGDILSGHARTKGPRYPVVEATDGLVVEVADGFVGAVVGFVKSYHSDSVRLEDRHGTRRLYSLVPGGFLLEGRPTTLVRPKPQARRPADDRSASGSRRVASLTARTALPSRLWVEGVHDAILVERVWGHDLRVEGIVVEQLDGLDNLPERLAHFCPGPNRRVGVLADHLVAGSKETRLVAGVGPHVMVTGHPFVDIWQAVKPSSVGISSWPEVPRGEDWKTGVCTRLGWGSPTEGWRRVQAGVRSFRDLDATLLGAVERLVDFITDPGMNDVETR